MVPKKFPRSIDKRNVAIEPRVWGGEAARVEEDLAGLQLEADPVRATLEPVLEAVGAELGRGRVEAPRLVGRDEGGDLLTCKKE